MPATNVNNVLFKTTFFRDLYAFFCIIYFICYLKHYNSDSLASQDKKQLLIAEINIPELDDKIIIHLINLQDGLIKSKLLSTDSHDNATTTTAQKNNKNNKIISTPKLYGTCYDQINKSLSDIAHILSTTIDRTTTNISKSAEVSFAMHS